MPGVPHLVPVPDVHHVIFQNVHAKGCRTLYPYLMFIILYFRMRMPRVPHLVPITDVPDVIFQNAHARGAALVPVSGVSDVIFQNAHARGATSCTRT